MRGLPLDIAGDGWFRGAQRAALVALVLLVAACSPTRVQVVGSTQFQHIERAFARTVQGLNTHPDEVWYSGWPGNVWVNWWGGNRRGLCFQWQEAVYPSVSAAAREVGWGAVGICLNENRGSEHHAVIVWDPALISMQDLIKGPEPRAAYVLDAWRRGAPDVFLLDDWLKFGVHGVRTSRLEDLDAEREKAEQQRTAESAPASPADAETTPTSAAGVVGDAPTAQRPGR